ncbi:MAG: MBL fold metallo-hydrolase [Promethearchaeota archaeon]
MDWWQGLWLLARVVAAGFGLAVLGLVLVGAAHRVRRVVPDPVPPGKDGVQYVGHGTALLRVDGVTFLTDPVLTKSISGVIRRFVSVGTTRDALRRVDAVLVSHWHADHFHPRSLKKLDRSVKCLVPRWPRTPLKVLERAGFVDVVEVAPGDVVGVAPRGAAGAKGVKVHVVPTNHGTAKGAVGYVVEGKTWTAYFPGDTALDEQVMRGVGERFRVDLALLPIGCYEGRLFGFVPVSFRSIHMGPADLPRALEWVRPKRVVPVHWGVFRLGTEPARRSVEELRRMLDAGELPRERFAVLEPGQWADLQDLGLRED